MKITLTENGNGPQVWDFDPDDVRARDAELIEAKLGVAWESFPLAVMQGSVRARRALLWHLRRQAHPKLRLDDVDFRPKDLKVELDVPEWRLWRGKIALMGDLSDELRDRALAWVDQELAQAEAGEDPAAAAAPGKADSAPPASVTSS
ncbi:hypothetical protein [Amycolatopsis eburnea]|uniref:Uncharacterized protein n=1 Tax=Amycolatopsis eburnea TaxID=2267691 RepID=A0A3R9E557_9PSEU|nr:hypothetical protein [Amycolatopsis eburnea]RSD26346.1 hypothetical protein EIY87_00335 [Amycolatopsis eburnea]